MTDDLAQLRSLLASGEPVNWVFAGDSITHGLLHTQGARTYVEHLHELIRGDMGRVQDVLINTGISGWRAVQVLEDFERRVAAWQPHIVTLMIGTNDCSTGGTFPVIEPSDFAASLGEFVARVRALGALPVLLTQPPIDVLNAPERARIADFAQAVRDVAQREGTILVDQFARFAELGSQKASGVAWGLLGDSFHPNAAGHAVLALGVAETLGLAPSPSRVLPDLHRRVELGL